MWRVGFGYDVHRVIEGRALVLGGVEIPSPFGLDGHSDADVVLHALADAILGATGKGDIGDHFPPDDERWRDADSADLLMRSCRIAGEHWGVVNADIVIVAEAPKIGPYRQAMRERIASAIDIPVHQISVKATTNERLGSIGRGEGIAAMATVLMQYVGDSTSETTI